MFSQRKENTGSTEYHFQLTAQNYEKLKQHMQSVQKLFHGSWWKELFPAENKTSYFF